MSNEALGNRHCLNGDFQFRTPMRNPENTLYCLLRLFLCIGFRIGVRN